MPQERIQQICGALLAIPALQDENTRTLLLDEVANELGLLLSVVRHQEARYDLYRILRACERQPRGLEILMDVIEGFHQGSTALESAKSLVEEWEKELQRRHWEADLVSILSGVDTESVAAAFAQITTLPAGLKSTAEIVRHGGWINSDRWHMPAAIVLAELLGHVHRDLLHTESHQWIARVAHGLGLSGHAVDRLCATVNAQVSHRPAEFPLGAPSLSSAGTAYSSEEHISDLNKILDSENDVRKTTIIEEALKLPSAYSSPIRGGVPARNTAFTGREELLGKLHQTLHDRERISVLPETLHGLGGVGKTQVAIEYVYRHLDDYDLVWWISAEELSLVRASLSDLAMQMGLTPSQSMEHTARSVLNALSTYPGKWLLVYDNADRPSDLRGLIPSSGGHVIVTSRNPEWAMDGAALEVDVFTRTESVSLLHKRQSGMSAQDADRLADKLGDLPLALEQAAIWLGTTVTTVDEYLDVFDQQVSVLMDEGKPKDYPMTVLAFLGLAFERLREEAPASAQLLELFAFFGPEPVSVKLLWAGRDAGISGPLHEALRDRIETSRAVRELGRLGLAKVDPNRQRLQVHRLVQLVLREELKEERRSEGQRNVQRLLAAANPGDPDDEGTWRTYAEIGPHIQSAGLAGGDRDAQRIALDHLRYLFRIGDHVGCRDRAEEVLKLWSRPIEEGGLGTDDPFTLLATRRLADAVRSLGDHARARQLDQEAWEGMRRSLGDEHEYTLATVNSVGADLRIAGELEEARRLDEHNLELHRRILGDGDPATLLCMNNVAVSRRMLGDFDAAFDMDQEAISQWEATIGQEAHLLNSISNLVRDLHGLGRYQEALDMQQDSLPRLLQLLGPNHNWVLRAERNIAIALRKTGAIEGALAYSKELYERHHSQFGANHEHTLAAIMTYANALRVNGELLKARQLAADAIRTYSELFGQKHLLTLSANVNLAIIARGLGDFREAKALDESTKDLMVKALGANHPYLLCLVNNYANDLVNTHRLAQAREISEGLLTLSTRVRGPKHPYTMFCAANAALDLIETGDEPTGEARLNEAVQALSETLGGDHFEVIAIRAQRRAECDIEPPPT